LLSEAKLEKMGARASEELLESLLPGRLDCLKTRPDGMILDGHHRIKVLRERGVNVDTLPR
jgi:ParB-like chromosome segregation protein Spo0J